MANDSVVSVEVRISLTLRYVVFISELPLTLPLSIVLDWGRNSFPREYSQQNL